MTDRYAQRIPTSRSVPGTGVRTEIGKDGPADTAIASVIVMVEEPS
jgi:hypothetical protein